jgi:hypothetical protein
MVKRLGAVSSQELEHSRRRAMMAAAHRCNLRVFMDMLEVRSFQASQMKPSSTSNLACQPSFLALIFAATPNHPSAGRTEKPTQEPEWFFNVMGPAL